MNKKQIVVTTEDTIGLYDRNNLNTSKIRKKALHEQLYENYNINEKEIAKDNKANKMIPKSWQKEIIEFNAEYTTNNGEVKPIDRKFNGDSYIITFQTREDTQNFINEFNINLFKSINFILEKKDENPSVYNRTVVVESTESDYRLEILIT